MVRLRFFCSPNQNIRKKLLDELTFTDVLCDCEGLSSVERHRPVDGLRRAHDDLLGRLDPGGLRWRLDQRLVVQQRNGVVGVGAEQLLGGGRLLGVGGRRRRRGRLLRVHARQLRLDGGAARGLSVGRVARNWRNT